MMALKPMMNVPCVCQRQNGRMVNITRVSLAEWRVDDVRAIGEILAALQARRRAACRAGYPGHAMTTRGFMSSERAERPERPQHHQPPPRPPKPPSNAGCGGRRRQATAASDPTPSAQPTSPSAACSDRHRPAASKATRSTATADRSTGQRAPELPGRNTSVLLIGAAFGVVTAYTGIEQRAAAVVHRQSDSR